MVIATGDHPLKIGSLNRHFDPKQLRRLSFDPLDGFAETVTKLKVAGEVQDRFVWICAVPYLRMYVVLPAPLRICIDITAARSEQKPRRRKVFSITPYTGDAPSLVGEITQVTAPASVVIAQEQQTSVVIQKDPAGEMNGLQTSDPAQYEDGFPEDFVDAKDHFEEKEAAGLDIHQGR